VETGDSAWLAPPGRRWRITKQAGSDDAGVMRPMAGGVPAIAWTGSGNVTPIDALMFVKGLMTFS
jgi:hypothetical protein